MRLIIKNLTKRIDNLTILDKVTYSFESGIIYGLSGTRGSGKSIFFRCVSGEEPFNKGHIRIEIDGEEKRIGYTDVGCVFNDSQIPRVLTGREFVKFFIENSGMEYTEEEIEQYLEMVGINKEQGNKLIRSYSVGKKNLLQLLCVYITKPYIVLVEEPNEDYEDADVDNMQKVLDELKAESVVIVASGKEELIEQISDEIILIKDGELLDMDVDVVTLSMEE